MNIQPQQVNANNVFTDDRLQDFLSADNLQTMINTWHGIQPIATKNKTEFLRAVNAEIAHIDFLLNEQLNQIIHHNIFQRLETLWLGVSHLIQIKESTEDIKIRLLDASWKEVSRDLSKSMEFDQSMLFDKIYNAEFDSPGGEPFGVILGDYYLNLQGEGSIIDLDALQNLAKIMAASFCPFIAGLTAQSFELETFNEPLVFSFLDKIFKQPHYNRWQMLRKDPNSRFIGLTIPKILFRKPYIGVNENSKDFCFNENILSNNNENYLWGNSCFLFGMILLQSYKFYGWPGNIRASYLEMPKTNSCEYLFKPEFIIDEQDESALSELGIISVFWHPMKSASIFLGNASIYNPRVEGQQSEDVNNRISSMLQYILCASRFAHFVKIIGRDKIGRLQTAEECRAFLARWIKQYVASNDIPDQVRINYPLQEAKIEVMEMPTDAGKFLCTIYLRPKLQLEKVNTGLTLITELNAIKN